MVDHVQGIDHLVRAMDALPKEMIGKRGGPVRSALRKAANLTRNEARRNAPVRTGALRSNIATVLDGNPKRSGANERFRVGVRGGARAPYADTKKNRRAGRVGQTYEKQSTTFYWRFHEFGTERMTARPFLRPAFESQKGPGLELIITDMTKSVARIAAKLARQQAPT